MNDTPFSAYNSGADFWRDTATCYGIDEALIICRNYLDLNLKRGHSGDEGDFCWELFMEMYGATASKIDLKRIVYPYSLEEARKRSEESYFHASSNLNQECARAIDEAINASHYQTYHYNLRLAVMNVVLEYGFERTNAVLARHIQVYKSDGRFSQANKNWAASFNTLSESFNRTRLISHATLIDDVVKYARKLYSDIDATRFALPGKKEHGEFVEGYEVMQAIMVDNNQGYAIAHNPNAVDPFACWQFYIRDGERNYNWGIYGEEQAAVDAYNARVFIAFSPPHGEQEIKEVVSNRRFS